MNQQTYELVEICEHANDVVECAKCREAIARLETNGEGIEHADAWGKLIGKVDHGGMKWQK